MEPVGIMISGYDQEAAGRIQALLAALLATEVIVVSASGKGAMPIHEILARGPEDRYADEPVKILMFLGFDETQIRTVLAGFPRDGEPQRPIFCAFTAQNSQWPLDALIEHLVAEHRRWTGRENGGA